MRSQPKPRSSAWAAARNSDHQPCTPVAPSPNPMPGEKLFSGPAKVDLRPSHRWTPRSPAKVLHGHPRWCLRLSTVAGQLLHLQIDLLPSLQSVLHIHPTHLSYSSLLPPCLSFSTCLSLSRWGNPGGISTNVCNKVRLLFISTNL